MIVVLAVLLALAGLLLGGVGFFVAVGARAVDAHILAATYLVGGLSIFGLALVVIAVRLTRPFARIEASPILRPAPLKAVTEGAVRASEELPGALPVKAANSVAACVNCGRPINHQRKVCECGKSL